MRRAEGTELAVKKIHASPMLDVRKIVKQNTTQNNSGVRLTK
jgi:hypothetical protein